MLRTILKFWFYFFQQCLMPGFASVMLSDAVIPAVYESYGAINNPELTAFVQSGIVLSDPILDNAFNAGGTTAVMPFWNDIDPTLEPNYSTDSPSDVASPNKINAGQMTARIGNMNQAFSDADLVKQLAGSDPMQQIKNRFGTYWTRHFQRRVINTALGVMNDDIANHSSDMVNSIALETTVGVTSANLFSRAAFTGAAFTMGDRFADTQAIAVHSVVYKRMVDNDDIQFERAATDDPLLPINPAGRTPFFLGRRVIVDDGLPVIAGTTSGFKYVSVLFGTGAIGFGQQTPPVPSEMYRRPDQANGGGVDQIWERKSWVIHPLGYSFTSAQITGLTPTLAELKLAANWMRVVTRKLIPLSFLITNG